jgi:hypothetical protein
VPGPAAWFSVLVVPCLYYIASIGYQLEQKGDDDGQGLTRHTRVTRHDPISIWEVDMGYRYGRSDINGVSIGISIWNMGYQYGIWYIDMVVYHIDMGY